MKNAALEEDIARLLRETGRAHHQAFLARNGEDPAWASWYAEYLVSRLRPLLGAALAKDEVARLLTAAEEARSARAAGSDWPAFYARFFLSRFGV